MEGFEALFAAGVCDPEVEAGPGPLGFRNLSPRPHLKQYGPIHLRPE